MESGKEAIKAEVIGTFPAQRFFETLAMILSHRENMAITVKVTETEKEQPQDESEVVKHGSGSERKAK